MLVTQTVTIKWSYNNKKHYESRGYIFTAAGDEFVVKVDDLTKSSQVSVTYLCNCCKEKVQCQYVSYAKNMSDICSKCSIDRKKQIWNDKCAEKDIIQHIRKEDYRKGETY